MNIFFKKANLSHLNIIFSWLAEPHIQEFWDTSQAHKDDIVNFVNHRKTLSSYCSGKYVYWLAFFNKDPFALFMSIQETLDSNINPEKLAQLSKTGNSYSLDYMIGDKNYLNRGYSTKVLTEFINYFRNNIDPKADVFLIDPVCDNPRAKHIYIKAGFEYIGDFIMSGDVSGTGKLHHLLIKKFSVAL